MGNSQSGATVQATTPKTNSGSSLVLSQQQPTKLRPRPENIDVKVELEMKSLVLFLNKNGSLLAELGVHDVNVEVVMHPRTMKVKVMNLCN